MKLKEILIKELPNQYEFKEYGFCENKSLIIQKSFFVGVQISIDKNEIMVDSIPPSATASFITTVMCMFANLFIIFAFLPYRKLEKDIAHFLKNKYN